MSITSEALFCTIDGVSRPIKIGTFTASETLNNRPTCAFSVNYDSVLPGDEGDEVIITRSSDGEKVFAGRVVSIRHSTDESRNYKTASFTCGGYEVLADRRQVAEVYINRTAGFIVNDLVSKYLAADGITVGTIQSGVNVPRAVFGYQQLSQVLRQLAEASGYVWYIDYDKALYFVERDFANAPFDIDGDTAGERPVRAVNAEASLTQYRNRQYIRYNELTAVRTERFAGDGERQTFTVEFPIANKPTVAVNGFAQTVGIGGLEEGKDWYWGKGSNEITQDLLDTALGTEGTVAKVADGVDVPFLFEIRASGNYAIATYHETGTLNRGVKMFRLTSSSIDEVFTLPIVTDTILIGVIANWIDENYILVQYYNETPNEFTQEVFKREGDILISTGATMNRPSIFKMVSNGRNIVAVRSTSGSNDTLLFTWNQATNNVSQTDSIAYDTDYVAPEIAISGQYLVQLKAKTSSTLASRIELIKIDTVANTFSVVDYIDQTGSFFTGRVAVIGNYVFVLSPQLSLAAPVSFYIYRIDTSADTLTFLEQWQLPSEANANTLSLQYLQTYGNNLVAVGAFSGGDLVVLKFDPATETLTLSYILRDDINGEVSISQSGFGVYDRVAVGDDTIRLFRFAPDILEVTYQGTFPNVAQVDDFTEQAARQTAEGGTGLYEAFQNAADIDGEPQAVDVAQAILERYGRIPRTFTFETLRTGLATGQIIDINWPSVGITEPEMLIERIDTRDEGGKLLWYRARCISGRDIGNWQEFWRTLRPDQRFDFGGSDILPVTRTVQDHVTLADDVTAATLAAETNWDEGNWDQMEWQ
jgi:hypothetical protein